jgi:hypothetical protein
MWQGDARRWGKGERPGARIRLGVVDEVRQERVSVCVVIELMRPRHVGRVCWALGRSRI